MAAPTREQVENLKRQDRERAALLSAKARDLGCPGNVALAEYVLGLETRLERIEGMLDDRGRWFGGSA